jgi:hypothetical protein
VRASRTRARHGFPFHFLAADFSLPKIPRTKKHPEPPERVPIQPAKALPPVTVLARYSGENRMKKLKIDRSKLLGFRIDDSGKDNMPTGKAGAKVGRKGGVKLGAKVGGKIGAKPRG